MTTTEQLAAELDELAPHMALGPNQSATLRAAAARLRELSEALKPFARRCADTFPDDAPDSGITVRVKHLRRAAQLTETHSEP